MKKQIIKKSRKSILHFPKCLKDKESYVATIKITESMLHTDDSCQPGWSKLWGVAKGHIHWHNSYRFVYRVRNNRIVIGYYAYIGGVSPQENREFKGEFGMPIHIGDILHLRLEFRHGKMRFILKNTIDFKIVTMEVTLPEPIGWQFPTTECYPNIKCDADRKILYNFINY